MRVRASLDRREPEDDKGGYLRVLWRVLSELLANFNGLQVSGTFTASDLVADILTFQHNLGSSIVEVTVIDPDGVIRGDLAADTLISVVDENSVRVDLSSEVVGVADWSILVRRD